MLVLGDALVLVLVLGDAHVLVVLVLVLGDTLVWLTFYLMVSCIAHTECSCPYEDFPIE